MEKEWKYIPESNGCYVSNYGEVKQVLDGKEKMLHQLVDPKGYMRVTVRRCDKEGNVIPGKSMRVHRLVGEAFLPKIEGKNIINHLDGSKQNNRIDNLEWTDIAGNNQHAIDTGLRTDFESKKIPIGVVDLVNHTAYTFETVSEACRVLGVLKSDVNACLAGRTIQTCGMTFGRLDNEMTIKRITAKSKQAPIKQHLTNAKNRDFETISKKGTRKGGKKSNEGYYVTDRDVEGED